ncbi:MAG: SurA N-terminal domain-containing protein [Candidatus Spechtbacterales bacterium]
MDDSQKKKIYIIGALALIVVLIAGVWVWQNRVEKSEQLPDGVVARVGDSDITEEELNLYLWDATLQGTPENPEGFDKDLKHDVLNYLIEGRILRQKAVELGINVTKEEILHELEDNDRQDNPVSRHNAETQILRDRVYGQVITRRTGQYITIRFDRYFNDDFGLLEEEIERIRNNREQINTEAREYATNVVNDLFEQLSSGLISFEDAARQVESDPTLDPSYWENAGAPIAGGFAFDGLFSEEEIKDSPFYNAFEATGPEIKEPYLYQMEYLANPAHTAFPDLIDDQEKEVKDGMWVLLNITDTHDGEAYSIDEWLEQERERMVTTTNGITTSFLNLFETAEAVHGNSQPNHANNCPANRIINSGNTNQRGVVIARTMYMSYSGAGPYNLSTTISMRQDGSGKYSYSGCPLKTTTEEGHCFDFEEWCCGDNHNPHRLDINGVSEYKWIHYDRFNSSGAVNRDRTFTNSPGFGQDAIMHENVVNGRTLYLNIYAEQEPPPPPPLDPATLIVRAMVGGVLSSGTTITQISGSPSGLGGTTGLDGTYRREHPNMDITNARLRAPTTAVGNDGVEGVFQNWEGCDSTSNRDCWITVLEDTKELVTARYQSCTKSDSVTCHNGNEWWVDACGNLQEMKANCGETTEDDPIRECRDGGGAETWPGDLNLNVWHRIRVHERGCRDDSCYQDSSTRYELAEDCDGYSCADGECLPPITELEFTAEPASDEEPLDTELEVIVKGTSRGPIVYNLWWDCGLTTNDVSSAESSCGALPSVASGSCASNANGHRCNNVDNETLTITHRYFAEEVTPGTPFSPGEYTTAHYTAKVIVERDAAKGGENATETVSLRVDPLVIPDQLPPPATEDDDEPYIQQELSVVIHRILTVGVVISTSFLALMVVIGGAYLLFAGASPAILATAKSVFKYAIIGYGVVLLAWMIMGALVGML